MKILHKALSVTLSHVKPNDVRLCDVGKHPELEGHVFVFAVICQPQSWTNQQDHESTTSTL